MVTRQHLKASLHQADQINASLGWGIRRERPLNDWDQHLSINQASVIQSKYGADLQMK
jgi:hypothetical protein